MLFVTAEVKKMGDSHFMAWAHDFKALVVQGETEDEVKKELLISLRAKIAYDTGLPISNVDGEEVTKEVLDRYFKSYKDNQFKVQLA